MSGHHSLQNCFSVMHLCTLVRWVKSIPGIRLTVQRLPANYMLTLNIDLSRRGDRTPHNRQSNRGSRKVRQHRLDSILSSLAGYKKIQQHVLESHEHFSSRRRDWLERASTWSPVLCCLPGELHYVLARARKMGLPVVHWPESSLAPRKKLFVRNLREYLPRHRRLVQFMANHREGVMATGNTPASIQALIEITVRAFPYLRIAVVARNRHRARSIADRLSASENSLGFTLFLENSCLVEPPRRVITTCGSLQGIAPESIDLLFVVDPETLPHQQVRYTLLMTCNRARKFLVCEPVLPRESLILSLMQGYFGGKTYFDHGTAGEAPIQVHYLPLRLRTGNIPFAACSASHYRILQSAIWRNAERNRRIVQLILGLQARLAEIPCSPRWISGLQHRADLPPIVVQAAHSEHAEALGAEFERTPGVVSCAPRGSYQVGPWQVFIAENASAESSWERRNRELIIIVAHGLRSIPRDFCINQRSFLLGANENAVRRLIVDIAGDAHRQLRCADAQRKTLYCRHGYRKLSPRRNRGVNGGEDV